MRACSLSPGQDLLLLVIGDQLLAMNTDFDLVHQASLDDKALPITEGNITISFRADGKFFVVNYPAGTGRKALTYSNTFEVHKSPSPSDPPGGLVQSVSNEPVNYLLSPCAYQPNGGIIAGYSS